MSLSNVCTGCEEAAPEGKDLLKCGQCQSVAYCSKKCQKKDWMSHKLICKHLNVGSGQLNHSDHIEDANSRLAFTEQVKEGELSSQEKQIMRLFESGQDDKKTIKRIEKLLLQTCSTGKRAFLLSCLMILMTYRPHYLKKKTNPLKILLEFVDANDVVATFDKNGQGYTALHLLAVSGNPDGSNFVHQVILGEIFLKAGADVNCKSGPASCHGTPLLFACKGRHVTNLDFIRLLLDHGADPNLPDSHGIAPLAIWAPDTPRVPMLLLEYKYKNGIKIDVNAKDADGETALVVTRNLIAATEAKNEETYVPSSKALLNFLLKQVRELESTLVSMGATEEGHDAPRHDSSH